MRIFVRLISLLLALALAAAGALLAIEVGWYWLQEDSLLIPWENWRESLMNLSWDSTEVRLTAWLMVAAGLLVILFSATARIREIRLTNPADEVSLTMSPRSLARLVGQRVRAQENVAGASVVASAKKVRVRATSNWEKEEELRPKLLELVNNLLQELPLRTKPQVSVVVDSPKDRR